MKINWRDYLTKNILPFWLEKGIDRKNGGIYTCIDDNEEIYDTDKSVWFQGRALWSFAMAYNTVEKREEYLEACEELYRFLKKIEAPNGRLPFVVTEEGEEVLSRAYYYSEAFAAIGCAQYYKATGREDVWESAMRYFDIVYSMYKDPKTRTPEMVQKFNPCKVFGVSMIMLSTAQFMRNVGRDTELFDAAAKDAIEEMKNGGYIKDDIKTIVDYVDLDGNFRDTPQGRDLCPGHAYEAAWFVLLEGEIKNDDELRLLGKKMLDYSLPEEYLRKNSIVPTCRDIHGRPNFTLVTCLPQWWAQNEATVAYALAYNIFGDKKYKKLYERIRDYSFGHFANKKGREWYGYTAPDGKVCQPLLGDKMKGPFHLPRMLMALISLEETGSILKYIS